MMRGLGDLASTSQLPTHPLMVIQFHGVSCIKISTKVENEEVSILADPFDDSLGKLSKNLSADIVTLSRADEKAYNNTDAVKSDFFLIDTPGEYEVKSIPIYGIAAEHSTLFHFTVEGVHIAHLGSVNSKLTDEQLDKLGDVDILMLPVGGGDVLDAKKASDLVSRIEPRTVIPMHFKMEGMKLEGDMLTPFIKESGLKTESMDKWKVQKKDLPTDETQLIILAKT